MKQNRTKHQKWRDRHHGKHVFLPGWDDEVWFYGPIGSAAHKIFRKNREQKTVEPSSNFFKDMKWSLLLIAAIFAGGYGRAQDTLIDRGIYQIRFNKQLRQPVEVTYTLYHGGGSCSRNNDHFRGDRFTLHDQDYHSTGFDRGHLVPAEDFAYSDSLQALTFSYYNCVPQLPGFNRGRWAKLERQTRQQSWFDTISVRIKCLDHIRVGSLWIPTRYERIIK